MTPSGCNTVNPESDDGLSYFEGVSDVPSDAAKLITSLAHAGYIDCLHTYGTFSQIGGFRREMALKALAELKAQQIKVDVWVNHGDTHDFQNIGRLGLGDYPFAVSSDGTKHHSLEYHTDLTLEYGIVFAWMQVITPVVGQDRKYGFVEHFFRLRAFKNPVVLMANLAELVGRKVLGRPSQMPCEGDNRLLTLETLRDGQRMYAFKRFNIPREDNPAYLNETADDLPNLISPTILQKLKRKAGYMVVYTHLAKHRGPTLSEETLNALGGLSREFKAGNIWVATTSRLLNYNLAYHSLQWSSAFRAGGMDIQIHAISDGVRGQRVPSEEQLAGITFYTPSAAATRVFLDNSEVSLQRNPKDFCGRESVTIPIVPLKFPQISS